MSDYEALSVLPTDIQRDWMASLVKATPTDEGVFRLVAARRTDGDGPEGQRVTVAVVDEDGLPMSGVSVAFSFSSAARYLISDDFLWSPPPPPKAFIASTRGGEIDCVQGGGVKADEPGGVTVYLLEPEYSSDVVTGAGMLADHTGLHLTFQLRRTGVVPLADRLASIEARLAALEAR